jgi:transcriptional regulator GlxA family with amidase domain
MTDHETCVSWLHYDAFRERFPDHEVRADRIYNLDASRGSCAGGSSAADIAAFIVRRHIGRDAERNALEVLQIERARTASEIQPRRPLSLDYGDATLRAAIIVMEQNIENALSVTELAEAIGVSRRQLERLFLKKANSSPGAIYRRVRLERARHLVLQTKAPLIEIAIEVGFENASHFARLFRKAYGHSPTTLRTSLASVVAA